MPRVKLIRHGLDDRGNDRWGFPIYSWGECPHPRGALRFDPRYGLPVAMYCRACGKADIHPFHGMTADKIAEVKENGRRLYEKLNRCIYCDSFLDENGSETVIGPEGFTMHNACAPVKVDS